MESHSFPRAVKQPVPLRVVIPATISDDDDDDYGVCYPCPPPPTPHITRRQTPLDAQRYDPLKNVTHSTSSQTRYAATDGGPPANYPQLENSAIYHFPPTESYDDLLAYYLGSGGGDTDSDAEEDSAGLTSDSEETTPADQTGPGTLGATTYRFTGASEDGDFAIERTIIRSRRFHLSKSLATLATRSTATLRTMKSFSRSPGPASPSPSASSGEDGSIAAPPVSRAVSRRPSLAVIAPSPIAEVTDSLKRLATRLHGSDAHFEEAVDLYEEVWPLAERGEPLIEVFVRKTVEKW